MVENAPRTVRVRARRGAGIVLAAAAGIAQLLVLGADAMTGAASPRVERTAASAAPVPARSVAWAPAPAPVVVPVVVPVAPSAPVVILYGDSLAAESQDHFRAALESAGITDVRTETFGGTALCDWLDRMRSDAADVHPTAVVIEFSGNADAVYAGLERPRVLGRGVLREVRR
jgi:hypothetical protein